MSSISEEEIRRILLENVGETGTSRRELLRTRVPKKSGGEEFGSVMYSLAGSPPRGYAIFIPELECINFYTPGGDRFACHDDVSEVVDVVAVVRELVEVLQDVDAIERDAALKQVPETVPVIRESDYEERAEKHFDAVVSALDERGLVVVREDTLHSAI